MTFASPLLLLALLLVPMALVAYLLVQRRRSRYAVRFTNVDLLANIVPKAPRWRRHVPAGPLPRGDRHARRSLSPGRR